MIRASVIRILSSTVITTTFSGLVAATGGEFAMTGGAGAANSGNPDGRKPCASVWLPASQCHGQ